MSQLPEGWSQASFSDLLVYTLGGDWGKDTKESDEYEKVKVIRGTDFKFWRRDKGLTAAERWIKRSSLERRRLLLGDIVVEISGGGPTQPVGRTILIDQESLQQVIQPIVCSNFFRQIRLSENLDAAFINHFLNQAYSKGAFDEFQTQTTNLRNLNFNEFLSKTEILVAPLAEQRRIVAKLETLLSKVAAYQQRFMKIPVVLKRFRQAVLAAACAGRLTAKWREEHADVKPASMLIKEKRSKLAIPNDELPMLPDTWEWVSLGDYAQCSRGRFSIRPRNDPAYFDGQYPFIQIGDLSDEGGWITSHRQTLNDKGLAVSKKFPKATVVIAIVGATIGNTGILAYDMCFTDSMVGIETGDEISNRYVELFLRHRKEKIRQSSYAGGGQPNIKLEVLNPYPLALPPLEEQYEIVRHVETLFKLVDQIEARYQRAKPLVDKLPQSILAKAFRGELVPTEAELARREGRDYEPASVLLERIRSERAEHAQGRKERAGSQPKPTRTRKEGASAFLQRPRRRC